MGLLTNDISLATFLAGCTNPAQRLQDKCLFARNGFAKRALDFVLGASAFLFVLPLLVVVTLAIRCTSKGPVFYKQKRVGLEGKVFTIYKFRSMYLNGDKMLQALFSRCPQSVEEYAKFQKLRKDPRITPIGRFLRKTSIDELPQLINVLNGTMSIVGQRPILVNQIEMYGLEALKEYVRQRPGITGLWQVSGRNQLSFEDRKTLDINYAHNWSLSYDVKLIAKTVPALLTSQGAR